MTSSISNHVPTTAEIKLNSIEDTTYVFRPADFPFLDVDPGQTLKSVKFTAIAARGQIYFHGVPIKENQEFSVNDIESGALTYMPRKDANGEDYSNFMFSVSDGIEYSTPQLGGFKIRPVEDEPILVTSTGRLFTTTENVLVHFLDSHQLDEKRTLLTTVKRGNEIDGSVFITLGLDIIQSEGDSHTELAHKFVNSTINSTVPLSDGRLLVTGVTFDSLTQKSGFFVTRFDAQGELDKSFNKTGTLIAQLAHVVGETELVVQNDGKYLICTKGTAGSTNQRLTVTLDRYNSDGTIDSSFSRFGVSAFNAESQQERVVVIQADGKILMLGKNYVGDAMVMMRLNQDGTLDQQFGTNASVNINIEPFRSSPLSMAVQKDGKILLLWSKLTSSQEKEICLTRFNVDGSLDKSFNTDGNVVLKHDDLGFSIGNIKNLLVSDDQKILITGSGNQPKETWGPYSDQIFVIRLTSKGSLDKSFDADGILNLSIEESGENPLNVFVDRSEKVLLTGTSFYSDQYSVVASYNNDGSIDHSFARPILNAANISVGVRLDEKIWIDDPEILSENLYHPTLKVSRAGLASSEDLFYFPTSFKYEYTTYFAYGGIVYRSGTPIASYTNDSGALQVRFEEHIFRSDLIALMRNITYNNIQSGEQRLITLDWHFDEGIPNVVSNGNAQTELMIASSVNSIPTASNIHGSLNPLSNHIFTIDEFQFKDRDHGDSFKGIVILSVPENKGLFLNNIQVREQQFVSKAEIESGLLRFRSLDLSQGVFKFSVSDGKNLSIPYDWTANVFETVVIAPEKLSISGSFTQGEALTAVIKAADVGDPNSVTYAWKIDGFGNSQWNKATLVPNSFDVGKKVELTVRYQDVNGNQKIYQASSEQAIKVGNDAPSGTPTFDGRSIVGETIKFTGGISDGDGIEVLNGRENFQFQWKADGVAIQGANASSLFLDSSFLGKLITIDISYRDLKGKLETVSGGRVSPVNEVTTFTVDDHLKLAKPGDNKFIGSSADDTVAINQTLKNFLVTKGNGEYHLMRSDGTDELQILRDIEHLKFQDYSVNLQITSKAREMVKGDLSKLIELYIAFFKRIPDADGLSYWIDQFNGGKNIEQIAQSFYNAGIQFTELTGFSKSMTNEDFIHVIYRNTLGRQNGADQEGLAYWSNQLQTGKATYGSLVSDILTSAHSFKGNPTWGWVADLLDNKVGAASQIAIEWGISFNSYEESITKGMEVIAAVSPTSNFDAIKLVGQNLSGIYL